MDKFYGAFVSFGAFDSLLSPFTFIVGYVKEQYEEMTNYRRNIFKMVT